MSKGTNRLCLRYYLEKMTLPLGLGAGTYGEGLTIRFAQSETSRIRVLPHCFQIHFSRGVRSSDESTVRTIS
jgi:hypothetical protein